MNKHGGLSGSLVEVCQNTMNSGGIDVFEKGMHNIISDNSDRLM